MPRTTKKAQSTANTAAEGISMILDTPVLKTVSEAASFVGCAEIRLLELFCDALKLPEALGWEVIPQEHEHLLNEFKSQANATVQVLPEAVKTSETSVEPPKTAETPSNDEAPKEVEKAGKMTQGKSNSSGMTKKSQKAIDLELKNAKAIEFGIEKTEEIINLQNEFAKGAHEQKKRELAKLNGRLKVREAAHRKALLAIKKETEERSEEDILLSLKAAGIETSEELLEDIKAFSEMALGKFQTVFEETIANPWETGLESDSTDLEDFENWNV